MRNILRAAFRQIALILALGAVLVPATVRAADLNITPVAQQTPEWCWAASAGMVLDYLNVPNLNQAGDYQCGLVGAQGGPCAGNCFNCPYAGGSIPRVAAVIRLYLFLAQQMRGFSSQNIVVGTHGILSPSRIAHYIDDNSPIIAGISPNGIAFPPGLGISDHAVVIEGYDGDPADNTFAVIVNDPFPPSEQRWLSAGANELTPGQYEISYAQFVENMQYRNSITFE